MNLTSTAYRPLIALVALFLLWPLIGAEAASKRSTASKRPAPPKQLSSPRTKPAHLPNRVVERVDPPACAIPWDPKQSQWVTSLAVDSRGVIWAGTEGQGLWSFDRSRPRGEQWEHFDRKSGLGDDYIYALAVDRDDRVWAGHRNHGVSVYNGQNWKNYGLLEGCFGERVFAIAVSPVDKSVWIATNLGLTRYLPNTDSWRTSAAAVQLPSIQPNCISFDRSGLLMLGTQCDGLWSASPRDDYKRWTRVEARLPTPTINSVLVSQSGTIYVATPQGVGIGERLGQKWTVIRGFDATHPQPNGHGFAITTLPDPQAVNGPWLEDYVTTLAEDEVGLIWLGFRQQGYQVYDPVTGQCYRNASYDAWGKPWNRETGSYIRAILPLTGEAPIMGSYGAVPGGGGLVRPEGSYQPGNRLAPKIARHQRTQLAPRLPSPARAPSGTEFGRLLSAQAAPIGVASDVNAITRLPDDWRTQGDWLGRYGTYAAVLCGMAGGGGDYVSGQDAGAISYGIRLGTGARSGDSVRYWVHWVHTDNTRSLQNPIRGGRTQAEWDDHGEDYPFSADGPGLQLTLKLPAGAFVVSAYFFNKDAHKWLNSCRDYDLELRRVASKSAGPNETGERPSTARVGSLAENAVRTRVVDFEGGVYKRFLVRATSPGSYTVVLGRNHSLNTIVSGIFLDRVDLAGTDPNAQHTNASTSGQASAPIGRTQLDGLLSSIVELRLHSPDRYFAQCPFIAAQLLQSLERGPDNTILLPNALRQPSLRDTFARTLEDATLFGSAEQMRPKELRQTYRWSAITLLAEGHNWEWTRYQNLFIWNETAYQQYSAERRKKTTAQTQLACPIE